MAIDVPNSPKVMTTTYDNFKGVDFTNDATNVWHRRSPTGTNMIPDASGRPFKRKGWEILLSQEELCDILGEVECEITKVEYFELAGVDHIVVFTNVGVIFYSELFDAESQYVISKDNDCFGSYDRCFFFEGNGKSAFYIYGNFRVWMFDESFTLTEVTEDAYIPTVLIGTAANGAGTVYEPYNLVGQKASVTFNSVTLFTYWASPDIAVTLTNENGLKTAMSGASKTSVSWKYENGSWEKIGHNITLTSYASVLGTPSEDDTITVVSGYGVMLPNNIAQNQIDQVSVWASASSQFDKSLTVLDEGSAPGVGQCSLHTDPAGLTSWIIFNSEASSWESGPVGASGVDFVKVTFPVATVKTTEYPEDPSDPIHDESTATLVAEEVI